MSGRKKHRTETKPLTSQAYERPRIKVRTGQKPKGQLGMTKEELDEVINGTLNTGNTLHPNGRCHDCGRRVNGERKFCGTCLTKHNYNI